jgi:PAS domain S-box-containing protein
VESLTHPFYVIDANDYTIQLANAAARLGDLTEPATCHELTHRNSEPCQEDHPCPLNIVKETKRPAVVEHIHYDKDGRRRNVEVHAFPILDAGGNVVQMIEYCLDITKRRQAEEALRESNARYRCFVRNFQGILFQGHMNFVPVFFHGAVEEITGYTEEEFTAGTPRWDQIICPEDLDVIAKSAEKIRTTPDYSTEREYRILRKDGQIRWVHELIQNVCDTSGMPHLVQGAIYDISERKQLDEDLTKHREHLEELVQARTGELRTANQKLVQEIARRKDAERDLLSIVERERERTGQELHDSIGQKLAGIAFMMEALSEKLSSKSLAEEASYVEKITKYISEATKQTRILAKGLDSIELESHGLKLALERLAATTKHLFGVSCTADCGAAATIEDASVAMNLYRIAQEAITNATKHGDPKNIDIRLIAENGHLTLTVENDGLPFSDDRMDSDGMGLKIMRRRAEMIGGSLEIHRRSHGGTRVACVFSNTT